jgi:mono/diheme cytochrome c family protein
MDARLKSSTALGALAAAALGFWCWAASAQTIVPAPFTQEQADAGRESYMTNCAQCHKDDLSGATAPALTGRAFAAGWNSHTTAELYTFIRTTMPFCEGGLLADQTYTDIVAFILSKSGAKPGSQALSPTTSVKIGDIVSDDNSAGLTKTK